MNRTEKPILVQNGNIITPRGIIEGESLLWDKDRILKIGPGLPCCGCRCVNLKGGYISPGLLELHIHGCGSWGFEDIDLDGFQKAAAFLLSRGVTAFVPTLQWNRKAVANLVAIIEAFRTTTVIPEIPGIYIEGPFINPEKRGGIDENAIAPPDPILLRKIFETGHDLIRIMTVSPELPGITEIVELLGKKGIIPSFGHSNCTLEEAEELFDHCRSRGIQPGMTHLFNASSPLSHKTPGLAMLPFTRKIVFELNGDRVHVKDPMLKLMARPELEERMLLISDALISAGRTPEPGEKFFYCGKEVTPASGGILIKESGTLAGSKLLIPEIIKSYREATGTSAFAAASSATILPRRFLGIKEEVLTPGNTCQPVLFDRNFQPLGPLSGL